MRILKRRPYRRQRGRLADVKCAEAALASAASYAAALSDKGTNVKKLVLLRHGESVWNRENRFTGWTDVDLSEEGTAEAKKAGQALKDGGFEFDIAYTSVL